MDPLELLRAHEPVLKINKVDLFLPTSVGAYVDLCSLWEITPDGDHVELVPAGGLDLDELSRLGRAYAGRTVYLRFVQTPLSRWQYWKWRRDGHHARMPHASRFAHVGLSTRVVDGLFRLSLLFRKRVPKGTVSAAEILYREHMRDAGYPYYGRVVHEAGWTVCQYWFFYAINDWRSSYNGINDHEADWETINVYLAPDADGVLTPRWVALSSHDGEGDALRRRVDDPALEWQDGHVVAYTGAGSHSHSVRAVDELIRIDAPVFQRSFHWARRIISLITPWADSSGVQEGLGIPFVDYHRGDGKVIGPGGTDDWTPVVISDDTPWVSDFRGRWGLDSGDRFGGESAPTGPRYERDGIDRTRWDDPLGWAGLQKVAPDQGVASDVLVPRLADLDAEIAQLDARMDAMRTVARSEMVHAQAMEIDSITQSLATERYVDARRIEADILGDAATRRRLAAERASLARAIEEGIPPTGPRDHLRARDHIPGQEEVVKSTPILRAWAAVSTSVLLAILIWLLVANDSQHYWLGVVVGIVVLVGVESMARGRVLQFLVSIVALAAFIALLVGFMHEWRITLAVVFGVIALYLLVQNVRELLNR